MKQLLRIAVIIACAVLIFWTAGFVSFAVNIRSLPRPDDQNTDAIIVLTGGPDRINRGLDLLEAKRAKYLFISGVNTKVSSDQLVSMWHKDLHHKPCCIILGHEAQNTYENAAEARDWIRLNNVHSIRLVTTDYHMVRAMLEFESVLPDIEIHPYALPSKMNLPLIAGEYNKTMFTLLRMELGENNS